MNRELLVVITLLCCICSAGAVRAQPAADAKEVQKLFDDIYGKAFAEAVATPAQDDNKELAERLRNAVEKHDLPVPLLVYIAQKTTELVGKDSKNYAIAIETLDALAIKVPQEKLNCGERVTSILEAVFASAGNGPEAAKIGSDLLPRLLALADALQASGKIEDHASVMQRALKVAKVSDPAQATAIATKLRDIEARSKSELEIDLLKKRLAANPKDKEARTRLVQIHVVDRDDPKTAATYIGEGLDEKTVRVLPVAAANGSDSASAAIFEAANWYKDLADQAQGPAKMAMLVRTQGLFKLFLLKHEANDLYKARASLLLEAVDAALRDQKAAGAVVAAAVAGDPEMNAAIKKIQAYLYSKQAADGSWDYLYENPHAGKVGTSALVTYALLLSGESADDPRIARSLEKLKNGDSEYVYSLSLQIRAWSLGPANQRQRLKQLVDQLAQRGEGPGVFSYKVPTGIAKPPQGQTLPHDHSNTGYALIALGYAQDAGIVLPPRFWQRVVEHYVAAQTNDGGWNYRLGDERPSYMNMTAEGLVVLSLAAKNGKLTRGPMQKLDKAYAAGHGWLETRIAGELRGGGSWGMYGWDVISRHAHARGLTYIGDQRWREAFLAKLYPRMRATGDVGPIYDTALALTFLAHSRAPRWCTRIALPEDKPVASADPVWVFTEQLQELHSGLLAWQTLSLDRPAEDWSASPVAYLASQQAVKLTPAQKTKLKQFLDGGGMLIAAGSKASRDSIEQLTSEMFPSLSFQTLTADHPLNEVHHKNVVGVGGRASRVLARDQRILVFNPPVDAETVLSSGQTKSADHQLLTNLVIWHIRSSPLRAMYHWKVQP